MKNRMSRLCVSVSSAVSIPASILACAICVVSSCTRQVRLEKDGWAPEVKKALNEFLKYNSGRENAYVVTDFDNTSCIFDIEEQAFAWQVRTMCFPLDPEEFRELAIFDPGDSESNRIKLESAGKLSEDFARLYVKYGPFGVRPDSLCFERIHDDEDYIDFSTRMMSLMIDYPDIEDDWSMRFLSGFKKDELYDFCYSCYVKFSRMESTASTFSNGIETVDFINGITVSENVIELWKALKANNIDVWICSASELTQVCAAVDAFGLHDLCTGVVAKTFKTDEEGRMTAEYDYKTGYPCRPVEGGWQADSSAAVRAVPKALGKVTAIGNAISPKYDGKAPLAGFMDSTGDFNFCTEFADMQLVVCYNRGTRRVTDGGGLIAEIALYQRDVLGLDFRSSIGKGETLYLLQGRDENGLRSLRPSNATIRFGETSETLFASEENRRQLEFITSSGLSVKEALDSFCIFTPASESSLGFEYGWLESYSGYHSR